MKRLYLKTHEEKISYYNRLANTELGLGVIAAAASIYEISHARTLTAASLFAVAFTEELIRDHHADLAENWQERASTLD